MKSKLNKILCFAVLCTVVLSSCTKNFQEINTDPINSPTALPQQLLAPALVSSLGSGMSRNRSFNNELMQVTVSINDDENATFRYDFRATLSDGLWNAWYLQLTNFKDIYKFASQGSSVNKSYQAISLINQVWLYSMLTDIYGDIPYKESNMARDSANYEPAFDAQKDIYLDLFQKLETANTLLATSPPTIIAASDPVYNGNLANWRKFGNSLYLRLLLRVSGKAEVQNDVVAKIKDMVDTRASTYPKFAGNADNAVLKWSSGVYLSPYATIREQDFRSPAIGQFFIGHLRDWDDPRINIGNYGSGGFNRWGIAQGPNGFAGVQSGYAPGTGEAKQSYFYSNTSATSLQSDPLTGIMMNYSELQFILAECHAKGFISTGSAQTYWETGVLANITNWLPNYPNFTSVGPPTTATTINTPEFRTYLTNADINWDNAESLDDKMERIHLQKYYALFLVDLQQWFEYRRTGHPILPKGTGLRNGGQMPSRMVYPVYVQSANPTNYKLAVARQGADNINTRVWWQKP